MKTEPAGANLGFDPRENVNGTRGGPKGQTQEWPGNTDDMTPVPDHGEASYRGANRLKDKVALITGGDSGIGRAVAIAFAREGADVAIVYFDEHDDAKDTLGWIEASGRRGLALAADLRSREACREVIQKVAEAFGRIDVLVNNAAFQNECSFDELTDDNVRRTFDTNILAPLWLTQAALPHLGPGASVINTGSVTGLEGRERLVDYAATKGALHTLTQSLASALSDRGIRVNCVAPGPVWTPLIPATLDKSHVRKFGASTAWKRPAQPIEIATSYVFIASSDARFYTGEIFAPTGSTGTR